jgi:hypothetical protein
MAHGVKTGGRKKGSKNKRTLAIVQAGISPLDYMLQRLRDENEEAGVRQEMAKAAAPYCHARLAAIEHTGKDGGAIEYREVVRKIV